MQIKWLAPYLRVPIWPCPCVSLVFRHFRIPADSRHPWLLLHHPAGSTSAYPTTYPFTHLLPGVSFALFLIPSNLKQFSLLNESYKQERKPPVNYELSVQITSQYKYSLESITDTIGVSAFPNTIKTINEHCPGTSPPKHRLRTPFMSMVTVWRSWNWEKSSRTPLNPVTLYSPGEYNSLCE